MASVSAAAAADDRIPARGRMGLIEDAESIVKEHMARYDSSHDWFHVDRVRRTALLLARSLSAQTTLDFLVVHLAALFHDITDSKYLPSTPTPPTTRDHLEPFYERHRHELGEYQFELVVRIVDNVSYSKEVKRSEQGGETEWHRTCDELHCVQDADKLDAMGAFGILRCSAYSGATSRTLFLPPTPATTSSTDPNSQSKDSALAHFDDKLFKLLGMLRTERGREMGRRRHEVLVGFKEEVEREWGEIGEEVWEK